MRLPVSVLHLTIAALLVLALPAEAHHSVNGQFDLDSRITLTGTVSAVEWVNPHAYVHLDVKNDDDTVTSWALETGPIARMRRGGLTKQALAGKPGEQVTVVGMPALKQGNNSLWLIKIAYEDGKYYILYPSPVELPATE